MQSGFARRMEFFMHAGQIRTENFFTAAPGAGGPNFSKGANPLADAAKADFPPLPPQNSCDVALTLLIISPHRFSPRL